MSAFTQQYLDTIDRTTSDISCKANDYPAGTFIEAHHHNKHQLVYAMQGVLCVHSHHGQWIVPPNRAIWMPAGIDHWIRCIGYTLMRSVYVQPQAIAALHMPDQPRAVAVTPLLRELIVAAMQVRQPYTRDMRDTRDGRVMALLMDELEALPALPLHLPQPRDARLRAICDAIRQQPDSPDTLAAWAGRLAIDVKTIQRLFRRETGMTFGQWRQQTRLLEALERLALGHKVVEVALELGYDSPSAFATMFKRQFGQTPSRFFA